MACIFTIASGWREGWVAQTEGSVTVCRERGVANSQGRQIIGGGQLPPPPLLSTGKHGKEPSGVKKNVQGGWYLDRGAY